VRNDRDENSKGTRKVIPSVIRKSQRRELLSASRSRLSFSFFPLAPWPDKLKRAPLGALI